MNRHILKKHKDEKELEKINTKNKTEKKRIFQQLRKNGILQHNRKQLVEKNPTYLRERNSQLEKDPVMCTGCFGFYARSFFRRHELRCTKDSCASVMCVPINTMDSASLDSYSDDFKSFIIGKLRDDDVGQLIRSDPTILMIGSRLYDKIRRKKDKQTEVRRSVRADMRRLGHLYKHFKTLEIQPIFNNATDMFLRKNFTNLTIAINLYTSSENEQQKSGLKQALCYLILNAAEKLVGNFLANDNDSVAEDISNFIKLYNLEKENVFGDASYNLNNRRNKKLKKPANLPIESDITLLRNFTIESINRLVNDKFIMWDLHSFVLLRNCTCTRLTLFNARRGGEPARLLLSDWKEADEGAWVDNQRIESFCSDLEDNKMKITYQTGKGNNHLVPNLFPVDTIEAMKLLSDLKIRNDVGIKSNNPYVFASGKSSDSHCSGWHALTSICEKLPIQNKTRLNATTNRHRLSTLIASQSMIESERNLFYEHMGHSEAINRNIYQAPPAIMQLIKTGKRLQSIDEGKNKPKFLQL